ncbi:hypothetical protein BCR33DRAFT_565230 [Rhizoclosmatium globosum]|uniref:L domain-like protein n=1 Tax=Rhizoclosmatium globosum TaxID=329046 RepID=A0A1Y2B7A5_9FUNG|nr:hypothetical protein BCR33DRAFT_565230 [Rhizoclosmatium globosum]|eukprot:ORY30718.1 hypothetical protein BCR33DRAFT_565230 [Rhizoclosmatium globosum]
MLALDLSGNNFDAFQIPSQISRMTSLQRIYLMNTRVYGSLPLEICDLEDLEEINLHGTNVDKEVDSKFFACTISESLTRQGFYSSR